MKPAVRSIGDSEKITINLGYVDLGSIDLLVKESAFANRTDFIRSAIRNELARHEELARQARSRENPTLGICHLARGDLEAHREAGTSLDLRVLGLLSIADDVSPELARATIRSVSVLGGFHASKEVKSALSDRLT
jgi:Arc/MetJ-type ribon-helix-helix transcriptional regulator